MISKDGSRLGLRQKPTQTIPVFEMIILAVILVGGGIAFKKRDLIRVKIRKIRK